MFNMLAAGVLGLLVGILVTRHLMSREVAKAYEKARKEFEQKKTELSDKIGDQLSDMRTGLVRTLEAYVGAVSVVRENLPISPEKLSELIAPAKLRLSGNGKNSKEIQEVAVQIDASNDNAQQKGDFAASEEIKEYNKVESDVVEEEASKLRAASSEQSSDLDAQSPIENASEDKNENEVKQG